MASSAREGEAPSQGRVDGLLVGSLRRGDGCFLPSLLVDGAGDPGLDRREFFANDRARQLRLALLVSGDFGARVHTLDIEELLGITRSRLLRWWTAEECFQCLGVETCPEPGEPFGATG